MSAPLLLCVLVRAQHWYHLPQTVTPTGDYTDGERARLKQVDPYVEGSDTAIPSGSNFLKDLLANGSRPMANTKSLEVDEWSSEVGVKVVDATVRNVHGTDVVLTSKGLQPAVQADYFAFWGLEDRPRRLALLCMDLVEDYRVFVGYLIDNVVALQAAFRAKGQPVFTSNWVRRPDDGLYGALDRFYGSTGVKTGENPMYIYAEDGSLPMAEIAPTAEEIGKGWAIKSNHLSKFADVDSDGRSVFYEKLKAAGVDTLVIVGAWTEDCVSATAFDAVDKYNLDTVVVSDGVGTATPAHFPGLKVMKAALTKMASTAELLAYLAKPATTLPVAAAATGVMLRAGDGAPPKTAAGPAVPPFLLTLPHVLALVAGSSLVTALAAVTLTLRVAKRWHAEEATPYRSMEV